jgi:hypothetical protein
LIKLPIIEAVKKQKCTLLGHAETGKRKGCYIEEDKNQQHWNQKQQEKK